MRNRAALLPHPADPFMFKYWLKFFTNVWGGEVDKLYILINSPMEKEVIDYMLSLVKDNEKIECHYVGYQLEHGTGLNMLLDWCKEDYIMLVEDDGYIFKPGYVDKYFNELESWTYDVVGSPRGSCSLEIYEAARYRFNLNYEGYGDHGPNFWPNFLFTRKYHLLQTDRKFGSRAWNKGEVIEPLGLKVEQDILVSDTFVNTSLQLRALGLKILEIPQYHASPYDMEHFQRHQYLFDGNAPWTHMGSLSTGTHGVLLDEEGRPLARRKLDDPKDEVKVPGTCDTEDEKKEWRRRVTMWQLFLDNADEGAIPEFTDLYRKAISRVVEQFDLNQNLIDEQKQAYHSLGL